MIGKIPKPGRSFKGVIMYNVLKHQAEVLDAFGVRTDRWEHTIMDFDAQRKMNPALRQAVGHISLSWSPHDADKLTPELMVEIAKEYLEKMKITNTQYLITQHKDRPHPHIHIVYNRVDNDAKTVSDQFQKKRNVKICRTLTLKHGYYMSQGKEQVNRERLTGADKIKYELYDAISAVAKHSKSWQQLQDKLLAQGIGMQYKYKSGTTEIQGISFSKGDAKFKGSQVDRSLSYGRLNQQIIQNAQSEKQVPGISITRPLKPAFQAPLQHHSAGAAERMIKTLMEPAPMGEQQADPYLYQSPRKRKRKNKRQSI